MLGRSWMPSARSVSGGSSSWSVKSTESPERADHAPAGIDHSGLSPEATITFGDGSPRATVEKRSIAAASAYGSSPPISAVRWSSGVGGSEPILITCASRERSDPFGFIWSSAASETSGRLSPSLTRIGAPIGRPLRTDAATAPCQLSRSTSMTALGCACSLVPGNAATAAAVASSAGSAPPRRVVFAVASDRSEKRSRPSSELESVPLELNEGPPAPSPSEHPAGARASTTSARADRLRSTRARYRGARLARRGGGPARYPPLRLTGQSIRIRRARAAPRRFALEHQEARDMEFRLSDEQIEFRDLCRRFAREVIRPVAAKHDREQSVPWECIRAARDWDLHGLDTIQRLGTDPDGMYSVIYAEELHWGCAGIALAIQASSLAAAGIASSGTPEQIARWIPECFGSGDDIKLGAYAVTEAGAGSDVKSLRTTATLAGDEWVLNGTKVFISNGGIADVTVVVATVDPDLGHRGQASFIVPKGTPGLSQGKKEDKIGIRASQTAEVVLDDCRVPVDYLLGGMDKLERKLERARSGQTGGDSNALATFEITRPLVGASALGIAQAAYEWTLEYLDGQSEGGVPLLKAQRIQQTLADVATEIEAARLLVQRAAWMGRNGVPMTGGQGSMSKLKAGDVTMWATTTLMDLVGEYAQSTECPLEKFFRDAKIYQIFEGTAQVQRLVVARMQRAEYHEQLKAAAEVLQQAPGTSTGDALGEKEP